MLNTVANTWYFPNLKAKFGECIALRTARDPVRDRITPICIVPPAGYDHELRRPLGPYEHLKLFGRRLSAWGRKPIFIDAALVDDEGHRRAFDAHPLTVLLERARLMGAFACPVTSLDASDEYQAAVRRFGEQQPFLPACIRVRAQELEQPNFATRLHEILVTLRLAEPRIVLMVDLGFIAVADEPQAVDAFADLLVDRISRLPGLHEWLAVVVAATSFPQDFKKLKAGEIGRYDRLDLDIYQRMFARRDDIIRMPAFSDYAVESLAFSSMKGGWPTAQFRYTANGQYINVKGEHTKTAGYEAIFEVAQRLSAMPEFCGGGLCDGDAYIENLAGAPDSTGNASMWRWASTDHHLAFVTTELGRLRGEPIITRVPAPVEQLDLWARA